MIKKIVDQSIFFSLLLYFVHFLLLFSCLWTIFLSILFIFLSFPLHFVGLVAINSLKTFRQEFFFSFFFFLFNLVFLQLCAIRYIILKWDIKFIRMHFFVLFISVSLHSWRSFSSNKIIFLFSCILHKKVTKSKKSPSSSTTWKIFSLQLDKNGKKNKTKNFKICANISTDFHFMGFAKGEQQ